MAQSAFGQSSAFSAVRLLAVLPLPALPAMRRKLPADPLPAAGIAGVAMGVSLWYAFDTLLDVTLPLGIWFN